MTFRNQIHMTKEMPSLYDNCNAWLKSGKRIYFAPSNLQFHKNSDSSAVKINNDHEA